MMKCMYYYLGQALLCELNSFAGEHLKMIDLKLPESLQNFSFAISFKSGDVKDMN